MSAGFTYLREQWYLLHNYTTPLPANSYEGGVDDEGELAAVWVDGLTVRDDAVLVRAPPPTVEGVGAFWRLVFQHKVNADSH